MVRESGRKILAQNKEARFRFFLEEFFEAGMVLTGTEVKSIRSGKVQMSDSYVQVRNGEAFLCHMHIAEYSHGNRENHIPLRERKLLLNRKELDRLAIGVQREGKTIVPTQIHLFKGRAKLEIALAKGKKAHDKRESIKAKEAEREMARSRRER
jgi:SsrA-binding protein